MNFLMRADQILHMKGKIIIIIYFKIYLNRAIFVFYRIKNNLSIQDQCCISNINNFVPVNDQILMKKKVIFDFLQNGYITELIRGKRKKYLGSELFYKAINDALEKFPRVNLKLLFLIFFNLIF